MRKIIFIWIFIMFLLVLPSVFSANATTRSSATQWGGATVGYTLTEPNIVAIPDDGHVNEGIIATFNISNPFQWRWTNPSATSSFNLCVFVSNETSKFNQNSERMGCDLMSNSWMVEFNNNVFRFGGTIVGGTPTEAADSYSIERIANGTIWFKKENAVDFQWTQNYSGGNISFAVAEGANIDQIDNVNWTDVSADVADTTPPHITAYSDQGSSCSNWNTNPSNPCSTGDTTPTLYFNTSESAFCAIGITNVNYTTMGSSRNCTSGEGTTEHACTLIPQDELVYEDSTVYLSCKDTSENENTTSTSGALSLTITGLETGTEAAIGVGVQNALLSGYTNYANQQIYARKLDGTQDFGTFDWVAKKGSKVWAFNYITKGEQHVGMFNLTPVLYVLEMSNITNATIINSVEIMINATK